MRFFIMLFWKLSAQIGHFYCKISLVHQVCNMTLMRIMNAVQILFSKLPGSVRIGKGRNSTPRTIKPR
jgi:hypothetical protein